MVEQIFFEKGSVKVTSARVIFGNQTHALSGITSVLGARFRGKLFWIPLIIILFIAFGFLLQGGMSFLVGLVLGGAAIWGANKFIAQYVIVFSSSSGSQKAYFNRDKKMIDDVVKAINDAIVHRG